MTTGSSNFAIVTSLLGALLACSGANDTEVSGIEVNDEPAFGITWETYRDTAVVPTGGGYIAEWDLFFANEEDLRNHYEREFGGKGQQLAVFKRISNGFEPTFPRNTGALEIRYCVSNSFSNKSTVVSDMATATLGWERVMNVRFRYDSSGDASCNHNNANVDLAVMPTSGTNLYGCGSSKMMWAPNGCPVGLASVRGVLLLDYGLIGTGQFAEVTANGLIQHEVGHVLGFRHEHPWAPGGCALESPTEDEFDEDVTGRRLTDYDQVSVMHYPYGPCNGIEGSDMSISVLDGIGGRSVYGMPAAWYTAMH